MCNNNNYLNPYDIPEIYVDTHYVCTFKRVEYDGKERRFKQFHEERIILTHISYIDYYGLYILNHCDRISDDQKVELNEKLTECIAKYVDLLESEIVLKNRKTCDKFVQHYREQIKHLQGDWTDFKTEISKNN